MAYNLSIFIQISSYLYLNEYFFIFLFYFNTYFRIFYYMFIFLLGLFEINYLLLSPFF